MEIWQAIILGFTQGLTEFLPVSSSGHLILVQTLLGIDEKSYLFLDVTLHLGTLIPVIIIFFKEIIGLFKKPLNKLFCLILATIPAAFVGFFLSDFVEKIFKSGYLLICGFFLTAVMLFFAEYALKKSPKSKPLSAKNSFCIGLMQAVAILPGVSRSGATISMGCFLGVDKEKNANFAFLMSIPVILGAVLLEGYKSIKIGVSIELLPLIFGIVSAMISGYIAIKVMLTLVKKANFKVFSVYLVLLSILLSILKLCGIF